jgi:hypothetical protein
MLSEGFWSDGKGVCASCPATGRFLEPYFPELVAAALKGLPGDCSIDGEVLALQRGTRRVLENQIHNSGSGESAFRRLLTSLSLDAWKARHSLWSMSPRDGMRRAASDRVIPRGADYGRRPSDTT